MDKQDYQFEQELDDLFEKFAAVDRMGKNWAEVIYAQIKQKLQQLMQQYKAQDIKSFIQGQTGTGQGAAKINPAQLITQAVKGIATVVSNNIQNSRDRQAAQGIAQDWAAAAQKVNQEIGLNAVPVNPLTAASKRHVVKTAGMILKQADYNDEILDMIAKDQTVLQPDQKYMHISDMVSSGEPASNVVATGTYMKENFSMGDDSFDEIANMKDDEI